jgi:hypothetical protein
MKPRLDRITDWFDRNRDTVARWKDNLVRFGRQGAEALLSLFERSFGYIRDRYIENPEFQSLSFSGKLEFITGDISASFNNWWTKEGGEEKARAFGGKIATVLGEGIVEVAPTLGKMAAEGVIKAFDSALRSSPLGAAIIGGLTGAGIGSLVPVVGTAAGFGAGTASGLITWGITTIKDKLLGDKGNKSKEILTIPSHAQGLDSVPYDNYLTYLHRGEKVDTRAEADQNRRANRAGGPIFYVTIQGMNKTTKQILDELLDLADQAQFNMGKA